MNHDIDRVATNAQLNVIDPAFGAALADDERQICAEALAFANGGSQGGSDLRHQLPHLFERSKRFGQGLLRSESIFPVSAEASADQCDKLLKELKQEIERVKADGKGAQNELDSFAIDYLIKLHASFISSRTGGADTPLYEQSKTAAIFAAAIYKLRQNHQSIECDRQDLLLISGDFFGIQKFIFDAVPASKAAKILRARSAFVQLLTKIIAFAIVDRLELSYQSIISTSAGKFEILGVNNDESKKILDETQRELNEFFIKEFFGETGVGICCTPCAFADFNEKSRYKDLRDCIAKRVDKIKFNKFDLLRTNPIIAYDDRLDNATLCEYCGKRKIGHKESCTICDRFIEIGKALATANFFTISKNNGDIPIFGGYFISLDQRDITDRIATFDISNNDEFRGYAKWELSSYVKRTNGKIDDFEMLAKSSCGGEDKDGLKAIMSLKGDVDGMGKYIKESDATNSFAKFNFFSRMIDYFFSVYATNLMKDKNIYTVFAGGDDIFILGAWDEVIEYAKKLRGEFMRFAGSSGLTISMGFVLTKPNKPINFTAETAEENLESAKHLDSKKDALNLFDETVKWNNYILGSYQLTKQLIDFEHKDLINTAFLYRLLELIEMRRDQDKHIEKTIWKSKLRYSFYRNVIEKLSGKEEKEAAEKLLSTIDKTIDESYQTAKMALCEYIYKRREING
ncbi:hypothetical protein AGMMS50229_15840 [Campylobacterota bacterium]|nr:hypothetical protein AGMMS50229_15840 [Campylobacterota bacterium]